MFKWGRDKIKSTHSKDLIVKDDTYSNNIQTFKAYSAPGLCRKLLLAGDRIKIHND